MLGARFYVDFSRVPRLSSAFSAAPLARGNGLKGSKGATMRMFRTLLLAGLLLFWRGAAVAQEETVGERAQANNYPLSVALPKGWESFPGDPKVQGEVLFLQSPQGGPIDATLRLSAFPMPRVWDDLLRRETYQLVVELDAPVLVNEALTLRGAKGHKWVYRGTSSSGQSQIHYRLYLALPATVGVNRLLVMHATAASEQSEEAMHVFGTLARSLAWGVQP
jgi:hypothetical protein